MEIFSPHLWAQHFPSASSRRRRIQRGEQGWKICRLPSSKFLPGLQVSPRALPRSHWGLLQWRRLLKTSTLSAALQRPDLQATKWFSFSIDNFFSGPVKSSRNWPRGKWEQRLTQGFNKIAGSSFIFTFPSLHYSSHILPLVQIYHIHQNRQIHQNHKIHQIHQMDQNYRNYQNNLILVINCRVSIIYWGLVFCTTNCKGWIFFHYDSIFTIHKVNTPQLHTLTPFLICVGWSWHFFSHVSFNLL